MDDHTRAVALALTPRVGWKLINRLIDHFGTLEAVLGASETELQSVHGIGNVIAGYIHAIDVERTAVDVERWRNQGITMATWQEPHYPTALHRLDDRPLVLFWKGTLTPADDRAIAIVGTRTGSEKSLSAAEEWGAGMAARGWTVISGLARGIDSQAHVGALEAHGRSVAILGSGVNTIYPGENKGLAERLIANGAIMSEVSPDNPPSPSELVFRNRLIAGLSRAVIVIEAGATSGAIYAAEKAHEQGHLVFAINNSVGNAAMLARYAQPLPTDADVLIDMIEAAEAKSAASKM